MFNQKNLRKAAAETTHTAAERGTEALNDLKEYLTPLAIGTKDRVIPLITETAERVQPAIKDARTKVENEVLPKMAELWNEAADSPVVQEAAERGAAMAAALKGDLKIPKVKLSKKAKKAQAKAAKKLNRKQKGHSKLKVIGVLALFGGLAIAIRQFLTPKDDGWTPQQPSAPYQPRNVMTEQDEVTVSSAGDEDSTTCCLSSNSACTGDDLSDHQTFTQCSPRAEGETVDDDTTACFAQRQAADGVNEDPFRYGEGAYIGDTPPEGFTIKGNERSMKFHTTESAGYNRTNADIWFNSEETAEKAGFTKAQR